MKRKSRPTSDAKLPAETDAPAEEQTSASLARQAARLSNIAAYLCFTLSCVVNWLFFKEEPAQQGLVRLVVDIVATTAVIAGLALALLGLLGGIREKSRDTIGISIIGLVLNGGIIFVIFWFIYVVKPRLANG